MSNEQDPVASRRLFFALWPDAAVRRQLTECAQSVAPPKAGRAVSPENLHLTLAFLGSVTALQQRCVEEAASLVQGRRVELVLDRLGYFVRPKALWLGASNTPVELAELAGRLTDAAAACGLVMDARPFQAHLTIVRKLPHGPRPMDIPPIAWQVASFALVRSETLPEGVRYEVCKTWPLA